MSSTNSMACQSGAKYILASLEDIPTTEVMVSLTSLTENIYERKDIRNSVGVQVVIDGKGLFVQPSYQTQQGAKETQVPSHAVLVRDENKALVFLPAVSGG